MADNYINVIAFIWLICYYQPALTVQKLLKEDLIWGGNLIRSLTVHLVCASVRFLFLSPLVTQLWTSSAPSTCTTRPRWRSFSLTWCSTSAAWCCTAPRPYPSGSRSFSTASSPCWSRKRCCTSCTAWAGPSETTSGATYCRSVTNMHAAAPNTCKASYGFSVNVKTRVLTALTLCSHTLSYLPAILGDFSESGDNVHGRSRPLLSHQVYLQISQPLQLFWEVLIKSRKVTI